MCYVKDCGRAIALLQLAPRLSHRTYNIASGKVVTNGEIATAVKEARPGRADRASRGPEPGRPWPSGVPGHQQAPEETGYQPAYDTDGAVADYITWLRDGHER